MLRCTRCLPCRRPWSAGFTLIELLVVIAVISLLVAILIPSLAKAKQQAGSTVSLSNLRQVGIGLLMYQSTYRGAYPVHGTSAPGLKMRWADFLWPYLRSPEVYLSPMLTPQERDDQMKKPFAHTCDQATGVEIPGDTLYYGGYGYNYQYLGNGRTPGGIKPYHASESKIRMPARTIAVADSNGSKDGGNVWTKEGTYVVDPPRMSVELGSRGSRKSAAEPGPGQYSYRGGDDGDASRRATPAERNTGGVNIVFCDGHAEPMRLAEIDDMNKDGQPDNGWWNGQGDASVR